MSEIVGSKRQFGCMEIETIYLDPEPPDDIPVVFGGRHHYYSD